MNKTLKYILLFSLVFSMPVDVCYPGKLTNLNKLAAISKS